MSVSVIYNCNSLLAAISSLVSTILLFFNNLSLMSIFTIYYWCPLFEVFVLNKTRVCLEVVDKASV